MDKQSLSQIALLHPVARGEMFEAWSEVQGKVQGVIISESYRTFERSNQLYKLGRTVVNPDGKSEKKPYGDIVSWAKAGQSWHNWGMALDIAMTTNGKPDYEVGPRWMQVVEIMKKYGWTWGGDFPEGKTDPPHFEKKYGQTLAGLMKLRSQKKFIAGTTYCRF